MNKKILESLPNNLPQIKIEGEKNFEEIPYIGPSMVLYKIVDDKIYILSGIVCKNKPWKKIGERDTFMETMKVSDIDLEAAVHRGLKEEIPGFLKYEIQNPVMSFSLVDKIIGVVYPIKVLSWEKEKNSSEEVKDIKWFPIEEILKLGIRMGGRESIAHAIPSMY